MNEWQVVAAVLGFLLIAAVPVALLASPPHGLVALEVASVLTATILMLLAEGEHRESFIDLAVVFVVLSTVGSLAFARLMERDL
jgi:multisubunit Na+/H+ antiporter MnhF subunit